MASGKKISCQAFLEDVSSYIDGDLPEELRNSLEAHLAKCPNCWMLFDETRRTIEIFQTYDCHPLPSGVRERLLGVINRSWDAQD